MFKKGSFVTANNKFRYISVENRLYLDGVDIFYNGKWAEIVSEYIPTQEEIDRVINYLKNKLFILMEKRNINKIDYINLEDIYVLYKLKYESLYHHMPFQKNPQNSLLRAYYLEFDQELK